MDKEGLFFDKAGLPSVPYLTVQYRILTLVQSVPYGTDNVPFFLPVKLSNILAQVGL